MLVQIPKVLSVEQVRFVREKLDVAGEAWVDGRATAGHQGLEYELGHLILTELVLNPLFISATLPNRVMPKHTE